ncbi:MAG TPA: amino acid ABC transporter permease [Symbiobacteriaceae bacterium]|nr:amino acid ABC transporter permease [Symbiobacteriaceae bacterium]
MSNLSLIWQSMPLLLKGAVITLEIAAMVALMGIFLGTLIGLGRTAGIGWLGGILRVYVEIIRGTPLYTQLLLICFGVPSALDIQFNTFTAAVITMGINSSAYVAEIIRAGIQSIDKGQMEAARSVGMSYGKAMVYIVLPQAFKRVIPPLLNEVVVLIKDSSLVGALALVELTRTAQLISSRTYKPFPALLGAAMLYLIMTFTLSQFSVWLERRLRVSD